jgi:rhomboid family GlyGly-CTERM serine protease
MDGSSATRGGYGSAGSWAVFAGLGTLMVLLQWLGADAVAALRYERAAILAGSEPWRLVTGHLVHHDWVHLGWNLAGLALVAVLFARDFGMRGWLAILLASTVAVDLGFLLLEPQLDWYVGFSGVLHGLMAAGLVASLLRRVDAVTLILAALLLGKLLYEHRYGPLPFTAGTVGLPVVHAAHTYGAVGGILAGTLLTLAARRRRTAPL